MRPYYCTTCRIVVSACIIIALVIRFAGSLRLSLSQRLNVTRKNYMAASVRNRYV